MLFRRAGASKLEQDRVVTGFEAAFLEGNKQSLVCHLALRNELIER